MPGFDFTAAASTDLIAKVGHGLLTGDGPLTTIVPGGSLGGLSSSADYWAIRIDADTLKVASSSADAAAGIPVDITSDLSGFLGIGVPYRRARNYGAGAQLKSADLNAFQDADRHRMHGAIDFVFPASQFTKLSGAATLAGKWTGVGAFMLALPFPPGTKIHWLRYCYNRGGAGGMQLALAQATPIPPFAANQFLPAAISAGTGEASTVYTAAEIDADPIDSLLPAGSAWTITVDHSDAANELLGVVVCASKA